VEAVVREVPPPPSAAVLRESGDDPAGSRADRGARRRHSRRLRGDLDTIVLKALRTEADRRYGSATELIEDVERHLSGRPVRARPDHVGYRAVKLVRRRPGAVAAGVAAVLAAGLYVGTLQAHAERLERERDAARLARVHAEAAHHQADAARGAAESERNTARTERERADVERRRAVDAQRLAEAEHRRAEAALRDAVVQKGAAEQTSRFMVEPVPRGAAGQRGTR
jgi:eukaryotic-like serine/threonine-protein kinase